jgi:hypothetical protein
MFAAPLAQSAEPLASRATVFTTQTLVGVLPALGIGSGAPKRHPLLVQFRLLPVVLALRFVSPSAVPLHATPVSDVLMSGTA